MLLSMFVCSLHVDAVEPRSRRARVAHGPNLFHDPFGLHRAVRNPPMHRRIIQLIDLISRPPIAGVFVVQSPHTVARAKRTN